MNFADAFIGLVCAVAFLAVFYGPWQSVCTDYARQIVFERRDAIFDLARIGKLDFESEDYRTIRSGLEVLIRFAHELTVPNFLVIAMWLRRKRRPIKSELQMALARIKDEKTRIEVRRHIMVAYAAMAFMALAKSLIGLTLFAAVLPVTILVVSIAAVCDLAAVFAGFAKKQLAWIGELIQTEAECA